jgi:lipopolysaccharide export LptBFGC system permease protein LptF
VLLLDRHIIRRFLTNFVILFLLVYLLATSIDIILQVDEFMQAVDQSAGVDAGWFERARTLALIVVDFHGPRIFQLFAYLLGLSCVGAMGFTLAQMMRHGELVALLGAGMSLYRVAWPIIVAAFFLNGLHLINSNIVLPMFASDLIRSHGEMAPQASGAFDVPFTADRNGALLHSPKFDRHKGVLDRPTIIERGDDGKATRRITAESAVWDEDRGEWILTNGQALVPSDDRAGEEDPARRDLVRSTPVERFATDLSPRVLVIRRYAEFAQMLSPAQIEELIATSETVDLNDLARIRYSRYAIILTNLLMLIIGLPFFLLRLPGPLLARSMLCAGASLTAMLGAFIGMEVNFDALSPAFSVFFPVVVLVPVALAAVTFIRT